VISIMGMNHRHILEPIWFSGLVPIAQRLFRDFDQLTTDVVLLPCQVQYGLLLGPPRPSWRRCNITKPVLRYRNPRPALWSVFVVWLW